MIAALIACILVLGFNYWVSSSRNLELEVGYKIFKLFLISYFFCVLTCLFVFTSFFNSPYFDVVLHVFYFTNINVPRTVLAYRLKRKYKYYHNLEAFVTL